MTVGLHFKAHHPATLLLVPISLNLQFVKTELGQGED